MQRLQDLALGFGQPGHLAMQEQEDFIQQSFRRADLLEVHCLPKPFQIRFIAVGQFLRDIEDQGRIQEEGVLLDFLDQVKPFEVGQVQFQHGGVEMFVFQGGQGLLTTRGGADLDRFVGEEFHDLLALGFIAIHDQQIAVAGLDELPAKSAAKRKTSSRKNSKIFCTLKR